MKKQRINVKGTEIILFSKEKEDYISITDIARFKDIERSDYIIQNWMRNRNTIELPGLWEKLHNRNFKGIEFDGFKQETGSNSFSMTLRKWIKATNAIGITSRSGPVWRYVCSSGCSLLPKASLRESLHHGTALSLNFIF